MEQLGYSLIDTANGNTVIQSWGSTAGQVPGIPNILVLPNGNSVNAPTLGSYGPYKLVKRMIQDNKPSVWHQKTSETVSYVNGNVVITYVYPDAANITPETVSPLQLRLALRQANLRSVVEAYVQTLSDDAKDEWEYATEIRRDNETINNGATALGKTPEEIDNIFRLAATLP